MKKLSLILSTVLILGMFSGCASKKESVVIYGTLEEARMDYYQERLNETFPEYDVSIQYMSTGNLGAKLFAEGTETDCDIVLSLENAYIEKIADNLLDLSYMDTSAYLEEGLVQPLKFLPLSQFDVVIVTNNDVLEANNLEIPKSYEDLLDPQYKGMISMPSPKMSNTGYMLLKNLVNTMGEEEAFEYFGEFSENVLQYTSSGSGPIKALVQGEVAIGVAVTYLAVEQINLGMDFSIHSFDEGAPYGYESMAIIDGKEENEAVTEVFDFLNETLNMEDKELFSPGEIFKEQKITVENYPTDIKAGDMSGNTLEEKERLLEKWVY